MDIIKNNQENLTRILSLLLKLSDEEYQKSVDILSGASIGQHVRHVLEFYACLLKNHSSGVVCYDERTSSRKIEVDRYFALVVTENVILMLNKMKSDHPLKLRANFSLNGGKDIIFETSLFRELAYTLEHNIHHQELIKVILENFGSEEILHKNFGKTLASIRTTTA